MNNNFVDENWDIDAYRGRATITVNYIGISADVMLRGAFEPTTGSYRWQGRAVGEGFAHALTKRRTMAIIHINNTEAEVLVSDPDEWGRYKISGAGRPPFAVSFDHNEDTD